MPQESLSRPWDLLPAALFMVAVICFRLRLKNDRSGRRRKKSRARQIRRKRDYQQRAAGLFARLPGRRHEAIHGQGCQQRERPGVSGYLQPAEYLKSATRTEASPRSNQSNPTVSMIPESTESKRQDQRVRSWVPRNRTRALAAVSKS